jgi:hypothetical protein
MVNDNVGEKKEDIQNKITRIDEELVNLFRQASDIETAMHIQALRQIYRSTLGTYSLGYDLLNQDGTITPHPSLPKDLVPTVETLKLTSLDASEIDHNNRRRMDVLQDMSERSIRDIHWYRKLFWDLSDAMREELNSGIMDRPEEMAKLHQSTCIAAITLSELLYDVSKHLVGRSCYILGIDNQGRIVKKALPGIDNRNWESLRDWINNIFDLGLNAVEFYNMHPRAMALLVEDAEKWTHRNSALTYPHIGEGFRICDQLLRFGQEHKQYFSPLPHEVIIRGGDIDTITVIDAPEIHGVNYKLKHSNGKITVGWLKKQGESYTFEPSDFAVRGWIEGEWRFDDYGDVFALVGAIARDMFVCEERHKFYKIKGKEEEPKSRKKKKEKETKVRWLPRFRIIYEGLSEIDQSELEERVFSVSPHYVSGHIRRVQNPSSGQLELAKQYGVIVPTGYTFVRPHERVGHDVHRTLYKSRSALQTLYGAK